MLFLHNLSDLFNDLLGEKALHELLRGHFIDPLFFFLLIPSPISKRRDIQ